MTTTYKTLVLLTLLLSTSNLALAQAYNPMLNIITPQLDIMANGYVKYTTTNAAISDARFTLFGDGFFDFNINFEHQFPQDNLGFTTTTYFNQRYKKHGPIIRTRQTGATGSGSGSNNAISMGLGVKSRIGTSWSPAPGIENYFILIFQNTATTVDSGHIALFYDDTQLQLNFTGILDYGWAQYQSHLTTASSSGYTHRLLWEFDNLMPGEQRVIYIPMTSITNVGSVLRLGSEYQSSGTGVRVFNNENYITAGAPHDPNIKSARERYIYADTSTHQSLTYTIRFQNEGNAPAREVIIRDNLDLNVFDPSTIQFINSEYPYTYTVMNDLLTIEFPEINLPGLAQKYPKTYSYDETESYIQFSICTHANLEQGTINNMASIYFDDQPPIHTNVSQVPISGDSWPEPISVCNESLKTNTFEQFSDSSIKIYPNPVEDVIHLDGLNGQMVDVSVYSVSGECMQTWRGIKVENSSIDVSDLQAGMYFVQISNKFVNITRKIVKN